MEITIKVERLLEPFQFQKKDGTLAIRNSFVGCTTTGQNDKRMKFDVLNEERWQKMGVRVGEYYVVSFDLESREWNGKWFTSLNAWRCMHIENRAAAIYGQSFQQKPQYAPHTQYQQSPQVNQDVNQASQGNAPLPF